MKLKKLLACVLVSLIAVSPVGAYASGVKPGDAPPKTSTVTIQTMAKIVFPSAMALGKAYFENPEDADNSVVYTLQISSAALQRQAGITGYTEEEYAALQVQEGFDPENQIIILCQTEPIAPGESIEEILLGALPSGETLPAGEYNSQLLMMVLPDDRMAGDITVNGNEFMVSANVTVGASMSVPFVIESETITLIVDEQGNVSLKIFNPANAQNDVIYSIQVSQGELMRVTNSPHRTEEELLTQQIDSEFHPDYEFISLFESEPIAPGGFLTVAAIGLLPDGQLLPSGVYTAWLVKYDMDAETGERTMENVNTEIQLTVPDGLPVDTESELEVAD